MQETLEIVSEAKNRFEELSARMLHLLSFVPDDKLTWSPSPTAKSSLQIVAHCALTSRFFADVIARRLPEEMPSVEEFFGALNSAEIKVTTREEAISLMGETGGELGKALDTVNGDNIDALGNCPFGAFPMRFWIFQGAGQIAGHIGQLEYLQTIWGDLDNHYG